MPRPRALAFLRQRERSPLCAVQPAPRAAFQAAAEQPRWRPPSKTIVACDSNSLAFPRTTDQVLDIVYLIATGMAATKGGFYPNGMNGTIKASAQ
jgi:hypothetical protein